MSFEELRKRGQLSAVYWQVPPLWWEPVPPTGWVPLGHACADKVAIDNRPIKINVIAFFMVYFTCVEVAHSYRPENADLERHYASSCVANGQIARHYWRDDFVRRAFGLVFHRGWKTFFS